MGTRMRRLMVLPALLLLTPACNGNSSTTTAPLRLTTEIEAELAAHLVVPYCTQSSKNVYVKEELESRFDEAYADRPMPPQMRTAIEASCPDVHFVTDDEAAALWSDDHAVVDGGNGVIITVGPTTWLADDVVAIEVGAVRGALDGGGHTQQYRWTGTGWEETDSEETGITSMYWVA
jgi:hypothetical protein